MSTLIAEIYEALKAAGVPDDLARAAAKAVIGVEDKGRLATKADLADLRTAIADLKADLTWRMLGAMTALTAVYAGILKLL